MMDEKEQYWYEKYETARNEAWELKQKIDKLKTINANLINFMKAVLPEYKELEEAIKLMSE